MSGYEENIEQVLELKNKKFSNVKIAEMLGCSESAIRKWLKRAEQ
jgi:uncharacterized protein YjcR